MGMINIDIPGIADKMKKSHEEGKAKFKRLVFLARK